MGSGGDHGGHGTGCGAGVEGFLWGGRGDDRGGGWWYAMGMSSGRIIVGIGEALFDVFPAERRLGGAPLNVAVHAQQLGNAGVVVSRVGQDAPGQALLDDLKGRGMDVWHIQSDPDNPTGTVYVEPGADGAAAYEIVSDVAWDYLQWDGDLADLADHAAGVCFGTLAQREAQTRNTIYRFLGEAKRATRLLDVNLRQDFYDRQKLRRSMELASAVKMNADELRVLADLFNLGEDEAGAVGKLMREHELDWAAVTRGEAGTTVYAGRPRRPAKAATRWAPATRRRRRCCTGRCEGGPGSGR